VAEEWDKRRRLISSLAGRTAARLVIKPDLKDPMSGFFLMRRQPFDATVHNLSQQGLKILLDLFASAPRPLRFAEIPYQFRPRTYGESKLDTMEAWQYGMLLADKIFGRFIPTRLVLFGVIGALGLLVHMTILAVALYTGLAFTPFPNHCRSHIDDFQLHAE
jgi:dolichol-phosphate mannosyltransferase